MPDDTENGVPGEARARAGRRPAPRAARRPRDDRELEVAVEREQQQEDQDERERQDAPAAARATRCTPRTRRPRRPGSPAAAGPWPSTCRRRVLHRAGEVAPLHRVLDADVARVVLAVDERGAAGHLDVGELPERDLLPVRAWRPGCCRSPRASRGTAAPGARRDRRASRPARPAWRRPPPDRRLDQAVDVGDVEAVARDLGAVDRDRQARLPQLLDQRHVADAAHAFEHALDLACPCSRAPPGRARRPSRPASS